MNASVYLDAKNDEGIRPKKETIILLPLPNNESIQLKYMDGILCEVPCRVEYQEIPKFYGNYELMGNLDVTDGEFKKISTAAEACREAEGPSYRLMVDVLKTYSKK